MVIGARQLERLALGIEMRQDSLGGVSILLANRNLPPVSFSTSCSRYLRTTLLPAMRGAGVNAVKVPEATA